MTALPSPSRTSHKLAAVLRQDRVAILLMAAGFAVIAALATHGHLVDQLIVVPVASFAPSYGRIETPFVSELQPIFLLISYFWLGGFAMASAILIAVDVREHLLPNVVVVPLAAWLTVGAALLAVVSGTTEPLVRFVVGGVVVGVVMFAIALFSRAGFGGGDVKLAAVVAALSAWLSWPSVLITFGFALGGAAVVVIAGMALGKMNRSTPIPFGPFLIAGTWIAIATFSLTEPPV